MKPQKITLEEIAHRKEVLKVEIREQKTVIIQLSKELFPAFFPETRPPQKSCSLLPKGFSSFLAIYDGFIIGMKIVRSIKRILKKR